MLAPPQHVPRRRLAATLPVPPRGYSHLGDADQARLWALVRQACPALEKYVDDGAAASHAGT